MLIQTSRFWRSLRSFGDIYIYIIYTHIYIYIIYLNKSFNLFVHNCHSWAEQPSFTTRWFCWVWPCPQPWLWWAWARAAVLRPSADGRPKSPWGSKATSSSMEGKRCQSWCFFSFFGTCSSYSWSNFDLWWWTNYYFLNVSPLIVSHLLLCNISNHQGVKASCVKCYNSSPKP